MIEFESSKGRLQAMEVSLPVNSWGRCRCGCGPVKQRGFGGRGFEIAKKAPYTLAGEEVCSVAEGAGDRG
jgi:hypothetical protein